jgi:hypothetical protein
MTRVSIATLGVFLTVSPSSLAQAPTPADTPPATGPQTPAQTTQRPDPTIDDDVKVTGCLRLWDASIGALPGEESTGPRYMITDVRQDESPGKDVVVLRRYVVTGDPSVNLAGHIDKTVRISGSVSPLGGIMKPPPSEIAPRQEALARPDPTWLKVSASAIEVIGSVCQSPSDR